MIKKKFTTAMIVLVAVSVVIALAAVPTREDRLPVSLQVIASGKGWGYEITVDGKTFIRQMTIPAVEGNAVFSTKEQALLVGQSVIEKLKTGTLPRVMLPELKALGITVDTINWQASR